ncbi:uncharacterized protein LOC124914323 [Impatiens glandulifera]|uniref:uncharacterized protein LOC124914323 n=1 Tax=Impatiens glandulifera TaxID=253017 RepID=UPI001FB19CBD|nr:uncharacterized protein LOC124914323 [Impatiens glandulifera]
MIISEYDIEYIVQKSIRGSILENFLADQPIDVEDDEELAFPDNEVMTNNPTTWRLLFDGASGKQGYGIGILLIDPVGIYNPISVKLEYPVMKNEAKYEACISGLKIAHEKGVRRLEIVGDSNLVISQANDGLSTLAAMTKIPEGIKIKPLKIRQKQKRDFEKRTIANTKVVPKPWFEPLQKYVEHGEYPSYFQKKERRALRQYATNYVLLSGNLYRRTFDGQNMLCIDQSQASQIMEEVHAGTCGPHMNGSALAKKILRFGYYWQNMEQKCVGYVKKCHQCQVYANFKHTPSSILYNMTSPWPFSTWGIDIIRKIYPHALNGHEFILVAIDYFTKYVEAQSYKVLKSSHVFKFICNNIIARYRVPQDLITYNGGHF